MTASEEGRVKRGGGSSPDSVLAEEAKKEAGAGAGATGKRKAGATGSSGSGNTAAGNTAGGKKEDAGKKIGASAASAAGKPKPQPRSTQQWRAAEHQARQPKGPLRMSCAASVMQEAANERSERAADH